MFSDMPRPNGGGSSGEDEVLLFERGVDTDTGTLFYLRDNATKYSKIRFLFRWSATDANDTEDSELVIPLSSMIYNNTYYTRGLISATTTSSRQFQINSSDTTKITQNGANGSANKYIVQKIYGIK